MFVKSHLRHFLGNGSGRFYNEYHRCISPSSASIVKKIGEHVKLSTHFGQDLNRWLELEPARLLLMVIGEQPYQ